MINIFTFFSKEIFSPFYRQEENEKIILCYVKFQNFNKENK